MSEGACCIELQQLVPEEESEAPTASSKGGEVTPPTTPTKPPEPSKDDIPSPKPPQQVMWENPPVQGASAASKESSSQANSQASTSGKAPHNSSTHTGNPRIVFVNEKKSTRPEIPKTSKQPKVSAPCKHHSFLSEVPDVRHMETALLQLLEDFHSGNLQAFGKDCSMEQMTEIREQQEKLAKLHFEMSQRDVHGAEGSGFMQSNANMHNLLQRLEQLSVCIEKLHSKP